MPRFYFHLYDDIVSIDEEGKELPDLEAAHANGIREARQVMLGTVSAGSINFSHWIEIADEAGDVAEIVSFADAVRIEG